MSKVGPAFMPDPLRLGSMIMLKENEHARRMMTSCDNAFSPSGAHGVEMRPGRQAQWAAALLSQQQGR
ncbi:hypothetical protein ACO34A_28625 (plasmid) [Rhizobium sp. ACO-34A]|nr:hypothetical protein ACO34A_28625 [Rhizobium sp. ACO-34A]